MVLEKPGYRLKSLRMLATVKLSIAFNLNLRTYRIIICTQHPCRTGADFPVVLPFSFKVCSKHALNENLSSDEHIEHEEYRLKWFFGQSVFVSMQQQLSLWKIGF